MGNEDYPAKWDAIVSEWKAASDARIRTATGAAEAFAKFIEQVKEGENK